MGAAPDRPQCLFFRQTALGLSASAIFHETSLSSTELPTEAVEQNLCHVQGRAMKNIQDFRDLQAVRQKKRSMIAGRAGTDGVGIMRSVSSMAGFARKRRDSDSIYSASPVPGMTVFPVPSL
jgi:hypothetical protein